MQDGGAYTARVEKDQRTVVVAQYRSPYYSIWINAEGLEGHISLLDLAA